MGDLRLHPPNHIAGRAILQRRDYRTRQRTVPDGPSEPISLPASDVLAFARRIQRDVDARFGVSLTPEPVFWGV